MSKKKKKNIATTRKKKNKNKGEYKMCVWGLPTPIHVHIKEAAAYLVFTTY